MAFSIIAAALLSALLHASWNVIANIARAPRDALFGISVATASVCVMLFPLVGPPPIESWTWIAGSALFNVIYLCTLSAAYARADFGAVYVFVRALVPLFVFSASLVTFSGASAQTHYFGAALVLVSMAIFAVTKSTSCGLDRNSAPLVLISAVSLSCALLLDIHGLRVGGQDPFGILRYGVASSLATALLILATSVVRRTNPLAAIAKAPVLCYSGAALLLCSYCLGMWAYSQGPIQLVAPLRESGILFGALLGVAMLGERYSRLQWTAIMAAASGVVMIRLV